MPQGARRPRRRTVGALTAALALAAGLAGLQAGPLAAPRADAATRTSRLAPSHPHSAVRAVHSCSQDVAPGQVTCQAERRTDIPPQAQPRTGTVRPLVVPSGYGPADLAAAYGLPSSTAGVGQTVYIVDAFDNPNAEADLAVYRTRYGLPACTTANGCFRKLNQLGATSPLPAGNTGWAGEMSLDVDMVSAVCPNCDITLIEANTAGNNDMFAGVARANALGAKFVSLSWGINEQGQAAHDDTTYLAPTGVVYTAASGDDGYAAGPIYPATSPRVIAVGGTSLTRASGTARGWTESAWSGAGSGCSVEEARPAWQDGATPCGSRRGTTDISAVADPATGVAVYQSAKGGWLVYGGTSASAPIVASVYALAGTPDPSVNPAALLYRHPHSLNDVTSGSTGSCSVADLCQATAGWDGPTGLGTPQGLTAFQLGRGRHTTLPGQVHPPGQPVHGTVLLQSRTP